MKKIFSLSLILFTLTACDQFQQSASTEAQKAAEVSSKQGYAMLNIDRPKDALPYFDTALKHDAKNVRALQGKGISFNKLGKNKEAEGPYKAALEIDKDNIGVINNLGLSYILSGKYEDAIELLEPYSKTEPVHAKVIENLALAHCLKGNNDIARKLYKSRLPKEKIEDNIIFCERFDKMKAKAKSKDTKKK